MPKENHFLCQVCFHNLQNKGCKVRPEIKSFQYECDKFRPLKNEQSVKIGEKIPQSKINKFLGYN
jgi:hypothetical protein